MREFNKKSADELKKQNKSLFNLELTRDEFIILNSFLGTTDLSIVQTIYDKVNFRVSGGIDWYANLNVYLIRQEFSKMHPSKIKEILVEINNKTDKFLYIL